MDSEKYNEMQEKIRSGKPVTDEGPYYHHVTWESYKGWGKGKLGGAVIGTIVGGVVGTAAALIALPTIGVPGAIIGALAFAGVGLWKGMDEFGRIGTVSAAIAAGLDTAERRNQLYIDGKINEIKAELGDEKAKIALQNAKEPAYRTTHYVPPQDPSLQHGPVFWKVAAIGLAVGVAAGLLLASSPLALELLGHIIGEEAIKTISTSMSGYGLQALSMATFGAFGASFGINRDVFRMIFDKTDMMYRGRASEKAQAQMITRGKEKSPEANKDQTKQISAEKSPPAPATEANGNYYDGLINYPDSATHFRDKQIAEAQKALLTMDHTQMRPN